MNTVNRLAVIDVDGVVADFEGELVEVLVSEFGADAKVNRHMYSLEKRFHQYPEILERALDYVNYPLFYREIKPIYPACKLIKELAQSGVSVLYLSSRPREASMFTRMWLQKYTWNYSGSLGLMCGVEDKADYLADIDVEFVLDDSPEQIYYLLASGKPAFCWSQPWNEGVFPRLFSERINNDVYIWSNDQEEAEPFWSVIDETGEQYE